MIRKALRVVVQMVKTIVQMVHENLNSGDFILVQDRTIDKNSFLCQVCYRI